MAISNLSVQSMVSVSGAWIDSDKERPLFEGIPMLAPFLPELEEAHTGLIRIQVTSSAIADQLKGLTKQASALDERHDRKIRGIYWALNAFAELAETTDNAERYLSLRDQLFPNGLRAVQQTYLDEAGDVALVDGRLTTPMRDLLGSLPVPGGNLAKEVENWFETGKKLGDVERQRAQLSKDKDEASVSQRDVALARQQWARVVQTVLQILDLLPDLDENIQNRILQPLKTAESKADRQRLRPETSEEEAELQFENDETAQEEAAAAS